MTLDQLLLQEKIKTHFAGAWAANDPAHREAHFKDVQHTAWMINEKLNLGYDKTLIMLAAYFHDLFAWSRHNHHEMSAHFIKTTDFEPIVQLSSVDRAMLAAACAEHRASFKGGFSCEFAELINSADRGKPEAITWIERAVLVKMHRSVNMNDRHDLQGSLHAAIAHLKDKLGPEGYARYPDMYIKSFGDPREYLHNELVKLERVLEGTIYEVPVQPTPAEHTQGSSQ